MKKLTDTQRKWALTACLASILSFNMVLSLSSSNFGSVSFASTDPRFVSMKCDDGDKMDVKFVSGENDKAKALVAKKLESGICYQCNDAIPLVKDFSASTKSLKAALCKALADKQAKEISEDEEEDLDEKPAKKVAVKKAKPAKEEDEEEQQEEDKENPDFAALRERCDKKDDDQAKLRCYASGLTKLLKNKKKTYDREEVMDIFRTEIEPGLRASLADITDLVPKSRSSRYDMDLREESNRREDAQTLIGDMVAQITGKYNYLRERLTKLAANSVLKNQDMAQQQLRKADQVKTADPMLAYRLQTDGYARLRAANQVANDLGGSLYDGLDSAQWSNYITGDQFENMYYTNYGNVVNEAIRGMSMNPLTYNLPNTTLADGMTVVDQNGQSYTVTSNRNPIVQSTVNGRNITVMTNNLTPANVVNSSTPRIAAYGGNQQGTASIQVFQGTAAPVNQSTMPAVRLRGQ